MSVLWILQFVSNNVSILKETTPAHAGKVTRWTRREFVKVTFRIVLFCQCMTFPYKYMILALLFQMWMSAQVSTIANKIVKMFRVLTIVAAMTDLD